MYKIRNTPPFKILLFFVLLWGCSPQSEESSNESQFRPWEDNFWTGNLTINGEDIIGYQTYYDSQSDKYYVCHDALPGGPLQTFSFKLWIPKHLEPNYRSGNDNLRVIMFFDGRSTELELTYNRFVREENDGVTDVLYSTFLIGAQYKGTDMSRDNFQQLRVDFDILYLDDQGNEVYRGDRYSTLDINDCQT